MSASMRGEEVRIRGLDMLESHIPHFYTDRLVLDVTLAEWQKNDHVITCQ